MKGMRGEADADGDKQVTVGELGDYLRANVSQTAGMLDREQTPGLAMRDRERVIIRYRGVGVAVLSKVGEMVNGECEMVKDTIYHLTF